MEDGQSRFSIVISVSENTNLWGSRREVKRSALRLTHVRAYAPCSGSVTYARAAPPLGSARLRWRRACLEVVVVAVSVTGKVLR
ncbi:hypothetical protein GCM10017687_27630 [Streptomyces echinatus]